MAKKERGSAAPVAKRCDALQVERVAVSSLVEDPSNVRRHPQRNIDSIKASLVKFGQQRPILVGADGVIIAGNGTFRAAKELNWAEIDVVRSKLKGSDATAYGIADNKIALLGEWEDDGLADLMKALRKEEYDLESLGFNDEEFARLMESVSANDLDGDEVDDPENEWEGMPGFEHDELRSVQKIIVHFKSQEDVQAFAKLVDQPLTENTRAIWYPQQPIIKDGEAV